MADAKPEEIQELLGGALFKALYKWMVDSGPVYLLPTGEALWETCSSPMRQRPISRRHVALSACVCSHDTDVMEGHLAHCAASRRPGHVLSLHVGSKQWVLAGNDGIAVQAPSPASWSSRTRQRLSMCCVLRTTPKSRFMTKAWSRR